LIPALDTNVLVRYLAQDDPAQFAAAKRLVGRCLNVGLSLFVPVTVVLKLDWVLRTNFGFAKGDVLQALSALFSAPEPALESERALEVARQLFRENTADLADCLHIALATQAGQQPMGTFDKGAAKVSGARLLTEA
jgi:predicted nucleic-acid-binding protein